MTSKLTILARINRNKPTKAEGLFWNMVARRKLTDFRILRQKPIASFIVDFYCPKLKLVIEIDGSSLTNRDEFDIGREMKLHAMGIVVIRYDNEQVISKLEDVFNHLRMVLETRVEELDNC